MDTSRFFPNNAVAWNDPSLKISDDSNEWSKKASNLTNTARQLMNRCIQNLGEPSDLGTLYCGDLGPRVYLRYIMAKHLLQQQQQQQQQQHESATTSAAAAAAADSTRREEAETMLQQALVLTQRAVQHETAYENAHPNSKRTARVTLLESPMVGCKVMEICLLHALGGNGGQTAQEDQARQQQLVEMLRVKCRHYLTDGECEVLYGRAGAMQAILFLRAELDDQTLGSDVLCELALAILQHGHVEAEKRGWKPRSSSRSGATPTSKKVLPFHWEWHGSTYLGAAHGTVGILQTILSLNQQELHSLNDKLGGGGGETVEHLLQECIQQLDTDWCFPSGNLKSSMESENKMDRLVHWCHGAPGHMLLLIKAGEVFHNEQFIEKAQHIANTVLWPRGLLRKGVGLCHGISGNAFCILALARTLSLLNTGKNVPGSRTNSSFWMAKAHYFANFALEHLNELERVPDEPYSLFEGVAGLCALLLALAQYPKTNGCFPLYEF